MRSLVSAALATVNWQRFTSRIFFLTVAILFISPIWLTEIPPMVDRPQHGSQSIRVPVYLHMPAWYQATKQGIAGFSFALFMPEMVRYTEEASAGIASLEEGACCYRRGFRWDPMDRQSTYFVVRMNKELDESILGGSVILEQRSGMWSLYRNTDVRDGG